MNDQENQPKTGVNISLNPDATPILYTDNIIMSLNEDGVVLDVCQKIGPSNQLRVVRRIGMSKSHAGRLVKKLEALLISPQGKEQTGEKLLN